MSKIDQSAVKIIWAIYNAIDLYYTIVTTIGAMMISIENDLYNTEERLKNATNFNFKNQLTVVVFLPIRVLN